MAVVLWANVMLIQVAYNIHDKTVGSMVLQEELELYRHDSGWPVSLERAKKKAGHPFSFSKYQFKIQGSSAVFFDRKVKGMVTGDDWRLAIEIGIFDPENFLRMLVLADSEDD